jgi:UDP-N-acetylmuramoyl-tripeptide--D-alanyl-D-alanine ligase
VNLTVLDLLSISHGDESGISNLNANRQFHAVSSDSRTIKRDDLFVALKGPNFDGHTFLDAVAKEGAMAAVVSSTWYRANKSKKPPLPVLVVKDTLDALGDLANVYRNKFSIPILVIAGSNGKTTTKELVAHVLSGSFDVLKTEANYNNQVGLPHMLFQLREGHKIAVLEIGTNHPGEIAWLARVAQPTHALITNIGREHLEFFKDLKGVAKEEMATFDVTNTNNGIAFVNLDDPYIKVATEQFGDRAKTYGTSKNAQVFVEHSATTKDGRVELRVWSDGKSFKVRTQLIADYAPNMVAAATAVGWHFGMTRSEIKTQIEIFRPHSKRLEVLHTADGITILNDAYNANPDSMEAAIKTLAAFPTEGKRYAVLGDMFELGDTSVREHRALGQWIAKSKIKRVFFTGKDMQHAAKAFIAETSKRLSDVHSATKQELAARLRAVLKTGDVVLIKGSRGMRMEELIDMLHAD